tara:strand:+ start:1199 stop:1501 length:303 start_codon:yes stop_codon:yes gene_type:complete
MTVWFPETREEFTLWALEYSQCSHESKSFEELYLVEHLSGNLWFDTLSKVEMWLEKTRSKFPDLVTDMLINEDEDYKYYNVFVVGVLVQGGERIYKGSGE